MPEKSKRGGLRSPKGGRPPKPSNERYKGIYVKLPPALLDWLRNNTNNKNGFIVDAIQEKIGRHDERFHI